MTRNYQRAFAAACLMLLGALALPAPAAAMQILEAADHAELAAEISATGVNRIALAGDRIARVVRAPDGYAVEHDGASGDLYLRAAVPAGSPEPGTGQAVRYEAVTLFIGTEKGFTYRLTLTPAARDSAQILIRNADALPGDAGLADPPLAGTPRVAALVRLVRAVARREPLPGYKIHAGDRSYGGLALIETWRGPRFRALVFEAGRSALQGGNGVADLAGTIAVLPGAGRVAALWLAPALPAREPAPDSIRGPGQAPPVPAAPGAGPSGGRLVVAVTEAAAMDGVR